MTGGINEIITGYNELVSERNELKMKSKILQQALHLSNLMIINRIEHSDTSRRKIDKLTSSSFLK